MGGEQGRGTQDFILAKPIRQLISKHPGAQEYFLNSEDEHLQGHMEKTSVNKRQNVRVIWNYSLVESKTDKLVYSDLMLIKN